MRGIAALVLLAACGSSHGGGAIDASSTGSGADATHLDGAGGIDATPFTANRDRLLATYLAFLQADPTKTQTNGLSGANLHSVCALWTALDASSQATFLTITARLEGGVIGDGSTMLDHVTKLYRAVGGGATNDCGGGENNRLIMAMDDALRTAQRTAFDMTGGDAQSRPIADIPVGGYWRDSHDAGGPHAPFDESCETNDGAPRGQTQYFHDATTAPATAALGRQDLETLVDPNALEMDEDYDCAHSSNPTCDYTLYGALCAPETTEPGTQIFTEHYGDYGATWKPTGC